ncbi:MAG: major capsid protein P2 [Pseudomonadota bacterium]
MNRDTITLSPFQGVAADSTAQAQMAVNYRYHEILLAYAGVTLAQMTEIRLYANGEVIHRYSATERDKINQHDGRAAASGVLIIPFDRYNLLQREAEEALALNTGIGAAGPGANAIESFRIEVDIAAGATAPVLSMKGVVSAPLPGGAGVIKRVLKQTRALAASENQIQDLAPGITGGNANYAALDRMFFFSGNVSRLRVRRNNYTKFDRTAAENNLILTDGVRVPQSGVYAFDTSEKGYGAELLELAGFQDIIFEPTLSSATNVPIISEFVGALGA